MTFKQY